MTNHLIAGACCAIYGMHPQYGSCFFGITQDEECWWVGESGRHGSKRVVGWISGDATQLVIFASSGQ